MSNDFSLICPCCKENVFHDNITHNLGTMAREAGIYACLWHPNGGREQTYLKYEKAVMLISILEAGLDDLKARPEFFQTFNPINGWGNYEGLVQFTSNVLDACRKYPNTKPEAWI